MTTRTPFTWYRVTDYGTAVPILALALISAPAAAQQTATVEEPLSWLNLPESVLKGLDRNRWREEAGKDRRVIPPAEFDRAYAGWLKVERVKTEDEVIKVCPKTWFPIKLGCSYQYGTRGKDGYDHCKIIMVADEVIKKVGYTPELVYRHEIGHCNGWPADHNGARIAP